MIHQKPWAESMTYIMQLPGCPGTTRQGRCGGIKGMTVLAVIGEIQRFGTPQHLASYSGLTGGLDQSRTKLVQKGITQEGRKALRWATLAPHCVWCSAGVVEVVQRAVKSDPLWKHRFQELQKGIHRNQPIVATPAPTAGAVSLVVCWNWSGMS